jgi:hypothetical protein
VLYRYKSSLTACKRFCSDEIAVSIIIYSLMVARKNNEPASWEVDAHLLAPVGETRVRRSYAVKELIMSEWYAYVPAKNLTPPRACARCRHGL